MRKVCLALRQARVVAFPAVGANNPFYSHTKIAAVMLQTALDCLKTSSSNGRTEKIIIVVPPECDSTYKVSYVFLYINFGYALSSENGGMCPHLCLKKNRGPLNVLDYLLKTF